MLETIVFAVIAVTLIAAVFLGWYFYQQARDKERMALIEKGEKLEDIFKAQKANKIKFVFPWLKLGIIMISLAVSFFAIGLVFLNHSGMYQFTEFLKPSIMGLCLGTGMIVIHMISGEK